jgi:hypothetical protein
MTPEPEWSTKAFVKTLENGLIASLANHANQCKICEQKLGAVLLHTAATNKAMMEAKLSPKEIKEMEEIFREEIKKHAESVSHRYGSLFDGMNKGFGNWRGHTGFDPGEAKEGDE